MKLRGQGEAVAASASIAMIAGLEGVGMAQCIGSSSCSAPYLQVTAVCLRCTERACLSSGLFLLARIFASHDMSSRFRALNFKSHPVQFEWQGASARAGQGYVLAAPSCARGDWRPLKAPPVRVAAHSSTAVFSSAGCAELWALQVRRCRMSMSCVNVMCE